MAEIHLEPKSLKTLKKLKKKRLFGKEKQWLEEEGTSAAEVVPLGSHRLESLRGYEG